MNFLQKILLITSLILVVENSALASKGVAKAIIVKGTVSAVNPTTNEKIDLKKGVWVNEGFVVTTEDKSFVKFLFIDKSQMNLGPKSEMAITTFPKKEAGIITLMKGSLRSKVTKNYLDNKDKDKSKLFIKTKTAAMGVRGTDFMVTYNPVNENTALVTFSGAVAMAQISDAVRNVQVSQSALEKAVSSDTAVVVTKGQFSGVSPGTTSRATTPVKINPGQLESMKSNDGSKESTDQAEASAPKKKFRNVIPPGTDAKGFSNKAKVADQVEKVIGKSATIAVTAKVDKEKSIATANSAPPEGSVNAATGEIAPPAGGYIDLATAQYIAPPPGSVFDAATDTFIPPSDFGGFNTETGLYENSNYTLTDDGEFVPTENSERSPASVNSGAGKSDFSSAPPKLAAIDKPMESVNSENFTQVGDFSGTEGPGGNSLELAGFAQTDLNDIIDDVKNEIDEAIADAEDERNEVLNNSTRVKFNINNSN